MLDVPLSPASRRGCAADAVVLLDAAGRACGTAPKATVHGPHTPFHLAFSCHVFGSDGRVLLTRRAAQKATWPSTWTNACCGHPRPGETLREAVLRHLAAELGVAPTGLAVALPDFAYRAAMANGVVEHELCPVVVATVDAPIRPAPHEADAVAWVSWSELVERADRQPESLSPWSVRQVLRLAGEVGDPGRWLEGAAAPPSPAPALAAARGDRVPSTPADVLTPFGARFDELMEEFLATRCADLARMDPLAAEVGDAVAALIRTGGKRLRPAYAYWGHRAACGDDGGPERADAVVRLGLALEMLHTFALIHDDVMDRSPLRRGQATVHEQFAGLRSGRSGAARRFGASAAIVAGDLAFVWSDELLDAACGAQALPAVRHAYARLRTEVIAGQYLDLRHGGGRRATTSQAVTVALLKSGRYTVTRPLEIGARLAGADDALVDALCRYGDATGLAFQLRDDVLGLFGDPEVTGKGAVEDLREGKQTLLVLRALELADDAGRRELERVLCCAGHGDERPGDERLAGWPDGIADRCREIVAASGALASVEALIAAQVAAADAAIASLEPPVADALAGLTRLLTARVA